jgi:hypothetical protein
MLLEASVDWSTGAVVARIDARLCAPRRLMGRLCGPGVCWCSSIRDEGHGLRSHGLCSWQCVVRLIFSRLQRPFLCRTSQLCRVVCNRDHREPAAHRRHGIAAFSEYLKFVIIADKMTRRFLLLVQLGAVGLTLVTLLAAYDFFAGEGYTRRPFRPIGMST